MDKIFTLDDSVKLNPIIYSSLVEQNPNSIVVTNCDGLIQYVNPRFLELTGYTDKEVIGQNPRILQSGETPKEFYIDMWNVLLAGGTWRGELCNKKRTVNFFGKMLLFLVYETRPEK